MKHLLFLFTALVLGLNTQAQLPDGSIAPDFTATDINGVEWNLYDLLEEGNTVILDFYATWCGPCWTYKESGILEELWMTFGPEGTGDLYIFSLESDDGTTPADLAGTGSNTAGDWITGTPFPMFDYMSNVFDEYENTYYPTIYTVCPDGVLNTETGEMEYTLVESGQASFDGHHAIAFLDCANSVTGPAPTISYNGDTAACGGGEWSASTSVGNLGSEDVTYMVFEVSLNGESQPNIEWTGLLASENVTVDLGVYTAIGDFDYRLVEVNGYEWSANEIVSVINSNEANTFIQVRITTDIYPQETGWEISNVSGAFVAGQPMGSMAGQAETDLFWNVALDIDECYIFTIFDEYGDGLYASQGGNNADGSVSIVSMDGANDLGVVWSHDGASMIEFTELSAGMNVTAISANISENEVEEFEATVSLTPNPFTQNTTLTFSNKEAGLASVVVYSMIGERVIEMDLGNISIGTQRVKLNFESLNTGVYIVSLNVAGKTMTSRITHTH